MEKRMMDLNMNVNFQMVSILCMDGITGRQSAQLGVLLRVSKIL